jgi:hypothetical protein
MLPGWNFWNWGMDETINNTWGVSNGWCHSWVLDAIHNKWMNEWMNEWMDGWNLLTYWLTSNSFWIEFSTHAILARVLCQLHIHASNLHWTENWCACMHAWMNELCVSITSWWYDLDVLYKFLAGNGGRNLWYTHMALCMMVMIKAPWVERVSERAS